MNPKVAKAWHDGLVKDKYAYNFTWLGRPIIQEPQDIVALQQVIWKVKPDLIIETGIAHGGSLVFSASMMVMLDMERRSVLREVVGVDVFIRDENKRALLHHPLYHKYISMYCGDSVSPDMVHTVATIADRHDTIMVFLDSNHTHKHVLAELEAYAPMVSPGSYCVVFDTGIEDLPPELIGDRAWGKGNNPKTAVWEFMRNNEEFEIDKEIEKNLIVTSAPDGWLRRKSNG